MDTVYIWNVNIIAEIQSKTHWTIREVSRTEIFPADTLLWNDIDTLYGKEASRKNGEEKTSEIKKKKLLLKLTEHEREWGNIFI